MRGLKRSLSALYAESEASGAAMSGDIVLSVTPATLGSSAAAVVAAIAADGFVRNIVVRLETAAGELHSWFNGTRVMGIAHATGGNGTAEIVGGGSTLTFVGGIAHASIEYKLTWAAADTSTFTVTGGTLLGHTVANKTSVDTLVA